MRKRTRGFDMKEDLAALISAAAITAFVLCGLYLGAYLFNPAPQETAFNLPPIERVFPNSVPALPR
jgi:hypothetical protein